MTERAIVDVGTLDAPGRSFQVENPYLGGWLDKQSLELAGNVSQTTLDNLQDTLSEGIQAGESIPDLRGRVQGTFQDAGRTRANMIARTEANKAANGAGWVQAQNSGVVKTKTWLATMDDRTRPEHAAMNGETVPIDESFSNGSMFPDDVNCRCTLTYGIDESKIAEPEPEPGDSYRTFSEGDELRSWGDEHFGGPAWTGKLTPDELQDISDYQNGPHYDLNHWLRSGDELPEDIRPVYKAWRDNLDSAIGKGAAPENITVFRGFENPEISRNFDALDGIIIGDDGFVSTTLSEPVARRFARSYRDPVLAEIRVPKGTKMGYVDAVNSVDEYEMLLPRGTRFRVVEAGYTEKGQKRVVLEVVQ